MTIDIEQLRVNQEVWHNGEKRKIYAVIADGMVTFAQYEVSTPISEISLTPPRKKVKKKLKDLFCGVRDGIEITYFMPSYKIWKQIEDVVVEVYED